MTSKFIYKLHTFYGKNPQNLRNWKKFHPKKSKVNLNKRSKLKLNPSTKIHSAMLNNSIFWTDYIQIQLAMHKLAFRCDREYVLA